MKKQYIFILLFVTHLMIGQTPTGTSNEVGITEGQLSVSLTGGASYSVPIAVPPGINGVVPQVGLVYNSQSGNGIAGYGWNISGVSAITRIPRTKFHDGVVGGVNLDVNDRFALDGQRLILKTGTSYGATGATYETENFSNVKITSLGTSSSDANPSFKVEYPDGSFAIYGATADSKSITTWSITYWENPQGIRISYSYILANNNLSIEYIKYGAIGATLPINEIKFIYDNSCARPEQAYVGGQSISNTYILMEIKVTGDTSGFRSYALSYLPTDLNYQQLESITETSGDGSNKKYNPTKFTYQGMITGLTKYPGSSSSNDEININNTDFISGDFDGDGLMDYVLSAKSSCKTKATLYRNISNSTIPTIGVPAISGCVYDVFSSNWLTSDGKVSERQGIVTVGTPNVVDTVFKTYSFRDSTSTIVEEYSKTVNFPISPISRGCREVFSNGHRYCEEIQEDSEIPKKYLSGDFNGDGLTDVIAIESGNIYNSYCDTNENGECYDSEGTSNPSNVFFVDLKRDVPVADSLLYIGGIGGQPLIPGQFDINVIDFDGDGKSDFMVRKNGSIHVYTMNSAKQLVLLTSITNDSSISLDRLHLVGDYNGDGKTDFLMSKFVPNDVNHTEWLKFTSTGVSFIKEEQNYAGVRYFKNGHISNNYYRNSYHYIPTDYDNDGKTDLICVTMFLETSYSYAAFINLRMAVVYNKNGSFSYTTEELDVNSIYSEQEYGLDFLTMPIFYNSNQANRKLEVALMRNKKILYFQSKKDFSVYKLLNSITTGNGVKESITYKPLTSVDNSGIPLYKPVLNTSFYPYVDINSQPSFQVVSMLEKQSASVYKKQLFSYAGATSNMQGLGFLGFRASMRTNWFNTDSQIISSISKNDPNLRGANIANYTYLGKVSPEATATASAPNAPRKSAVIINDNRAVASTVQATNSIRFLPGANIKPAAGTFIAQITPDYDANGYAETNTSPPSGLITKSLSYYEASLSASKVYKLQNTQSNTYNILDNTSNEINIVYDAYNNPIESITKVRNGGAGEQTTSSTIAYQPLTPSPIYPITSPSYAVGRPISKNQTVTTSGETMTTKETYGYGTGTESNLLKTIQKWGNNTGAITEANVYDDFGNITKKTISAGSESRVTDYEYKATSPYNGRFLTKSTDVERLSTTFDYNTNNGTLISETNPYNLTTTYEYNDPWFKKTKTIDYLGKSNTYTYTRTGSGNVNTLVTTTGDDGSGSQEEFDDLGRKIRSGVKDITGAISNISYSYDIYDRNYKVSEPYFGAGESQWSETKYDVYGRTIESKSFTDKTVTIGYSGLTTIVNDGTKTKISVKNAIGNVVSMTDTPGGTINYTYFANGNLKTTSYGEVVTTIEQDGWGRKTKLTDPSAGIYTYEYNALGETIKETTPNGITTYILDPSSGKMTGKTIVGAGGNNNTNSSTVYNYNGTTKLLESSTFTNVLEGNTITTTYTYDGLKRLKGITEVTPYATFSKTINSFDAFGRVETETTSGTANGNTSSKTIKNTYKNGYAWQILDDSNQKVLWQTNTVNARGQLLTAELGNGIAITNDYDPYGFAAQFKHDKTGASPENIMTLTTTFDEKKGNLKSRTNNMFGWSEDFTNSYDSLDRLISYKNAQGIMVDQSYHDDGRIKVNTLGEYKYANAAKKYQNTSVLLSPEATGYYADREGIFSDSMESGSGWSRNSYNPSCISFDNTTVAHLGNKSLKINTAGTGFTVSYVQSDLLIPINNTVPTEYTFSGWVKTDSPMAQLTLFKYAQDKTTYSAESVNTTVLGAWTFITKTVLVPANIKYLNLRADNVGTGNVWFDDVMIRKTSNTALVNLQIPNISYKDRQLNITYNAFKSPVEISEAGVDKISFTYNDNNDRSAMFYGSLEDVKTSRPNRKYYSADGSMEIKVTPTSTEFVSYIGGDGYSAPIVLKSDGTTQKYLYLHRDYQGSILAITDANGSVLEKRLFDAWGDIIKVQDGAGNILSGLTILDRGYTGHEHLQSVGLINMNARLYDPKLHRFLQPDNYVEDPANTQSYNRYGYCWNNPLKSTDVTGNWGGWDDLAAMAIGGLVNWGIHGFQLNSQGVKAFLIGAVAGEIALYTGGTGFAAAGGTAAGGGGFVAGAYGAMVGYAVSQPFLNAANNVAFGDPLMTTGEYITGIVFSGVTGGVVNGTIAGINGKTFWRGTTTPIKVEPITVYIKSTGVTEGGNPEIKTSAKLPSTTQTSTASTTQANRTGKVTFTKNVDGNGYKVEGLGIVDDGVSKNVQDALNTLDEIKQAGGTVKINPMNPNQELNMTIQGNGQKLDLRIESHKLPLKYGGDGINPTRHMNVDIKGTNLPNKGHIILE